MRFSASFALTLPGDAVRRAPTFWDRLRGLLSTPDLSTGELQLHRDVFGITEGVCAALREARVTDAVFLSVDEQTVYHDAVGVPNDAEALLSAAQADRLKGSFGELRALFTHAEDGLETLCEATFQRRFPAGSPAAILALSGRVGALRPLPEEPLPAARARLETIVRDPSVLADFRALFEELAARVREGLARAFPEATVQSGAAATFLPRPSRQSLVELSQRSLADPRTSLRPAPRCYHPPDRRGDYYDLWSCYYIDRGDIWTDLVLLDVLQRGGWHSTAEVPLAVVDAAGALLCGADEVPSHPAAFAGIAEVAQLDFAQEGAPVLEHLGSWPAEDPGALELGGALAVVPDLTGGSGLIGGFVDAIGGAASAVGDALPDLDLPDLDL